MYEKVNFFEMGWALGDDNEPLGNKLRLSSSLQKLIELTVVRFKLLGEFK